MTTCYFCKGAVEARVIDHMMKARDKYTLLRNIPALVCTQCGEVYFDLETTRRMDELLDEEVASNELISVPVVRY